MILREKTARKHRSATKAEKSDGLLAALQVLMADAFQSRTDPSCRSSAIRDAIAKRLHYSEQARKALTSRWSKWMRGLPETAGYITPEEISAMRAILGSRANMPRYLVSAFTHVLPDVTFWALSSTLGASDEKLTQMHDIFCKPKATYHIFRYVIGEPGRIAVGRLEIRKEPTTGAIRTQEDYHVARRPERYSGLFFHQKDGAYQMYSIHEGSDEVQFMQFRDVTHYTGRFHPRLIGQAKKLIGAFFDRHNRGFLYTGKVVIHRIDNTHEQISKGTLSEKELRDYDATIFDDLQFSPEITYPNLFTFRL